MVQRSGIDTIKYHTWPRIPMGKWQTHRRHHKREPRGQPPPPPPSRRPQSTHKQTRTKHSKHKTEQKHKRSTKEAPPRNGQQNIPPEGPNRPNSANLTPNSDADQDTQTPGPHERPPTHQRIIPQKTHKPRHNKETKQGQGPNSKPNRTPEQKKSNMQTLAGPTNSQSIRPPPSHQQTSPQVGTIIESEARPTGVQPKRKAKLPTAIGLTTKHAVCCNTSMPQPTLP